MAMDVFKAIQTRRSFRSYSRRPVPRELLFELIQAGRKAPSAGNLQDFTFVVTKNRDMINKLPELCMDQTWISSAQAVIAVCSQPNVQAEWYGEKGRHVFSIQNAAAATQNILLAAHASGLGACWIGGFDQEEVDKLFGTEGKARVETIVTVGYPNERAQEKHEKSIELMMYFDTFGNDKYDKALINRDYSLKVEEFARSAERSSRSLFDRISSFIENLNDKYAKRDSSKSSSTRKAPAASKKKQ